MRDTMPDSSLAMSTEVIKRCQPFPGFHFPSLAIHPLHRACSPSHRNLILSKTSTVTATDTHFSPANTSSKSPTFSSVLKPLFVLAHYEAKSFLDLREEQHNNENLTINLSLTTIPSSQFHTDHSGLTFSLPTSSTKIKLSWPTLRKVSKRNRHGAWEFFPDGDINENNTVTTALPSKVATFSTTTCRALSLYPIRPRWAPTVIIGGFGMHRMKSIDPWEDSEVKVRALHRFSRFSNKGGRVLDSCTGLGYTAMIAKRYGMNVVTVEIDKAMVEIQRRNPWSCGLFDGDGKDGEIGITRIVRDVRDVVKNDMEDNEVDIVIHDPPTMAMCGELYSERFYRQLWRITEQGGGLFHYIGDPASKEGGRLFFGAKEKLRRAGWIDLRVEKEAHGITAVRGTHQEQ